MRWLSVVLNDHPELALFLALAIGYAVGKLRYGSFTVGAVTGCLIAGVLIGQFGVTISGDVKQAFFLLFLFAIGYRTGPQFFRSLNAEALPQIAVTVVLCVVALIVALGLAIAFGLPLGTAAGALAGATTESATVGVAIDAFRKTNPSPDAAHLFESQIATAFAVSYLAGVISAIVMLSQVAPRLLRRPLAEACAEMEAKLGAPEDQGAGLRVRREIEARAFRIDDRWTGRTVREAEARAPSGVRLFIEQLRRGGEVIEAKPDLKLEAGDVIAVAGQRGFMVEHGELIGEEVDDAEVLDIPADAVDIVVTHREAAGRSLTELAKDPRVRTVFVRRLQRAGTDVPLYPGVRIERGDVLSVVGSRKHVSEAAAFIGYADRPTDATDMVYVALFIFLGGLIGIPALRVGALELGLGVAVGTLIGGLVAGWLRSRRRTFGFVPAATLWIFDSVGLSAFIACVGISAGPDFVDGLVQSGPVLVLISILVVVIAHGAAILLGSRVFHMNEGVLLGTCAGAGTSAPALAAVQEVAKSKIPTLGYGLGYALGNVLLAIWGAVLVMALGG